MTQKVTSNSITSIDVSKLSGNHTNATYGQNLTGINDGIIESASDPTASSNPTGGLGTLWVNYTSGEMYNLTNASTNSNYWTNVGGKSGDIFWTFSYQGTERGFVMGGGDSYPGAGTNVHTFLFSSSSSQSNHNNLTNSVGTSSVNTKDMTNGYSYVLGGPGNWNNTSHAMQRFAWQSGSASSSVGNLGYVHNGAHGYSTSSKGIYAGGGNSSNTTNLTTIHQFTFSSSVSGAAHGSLQTYSGWSVEAQDGEDYGYSIGRDYETTPSKNQKIALASGSTSYVSDAQYVINRNAGTSSTTHGYSSGGHWYTGGGPSITKVISRFQFSTGSMMTAVGNLDSARHDGGGCSGVSYGYSVGGTPGCWDQIDRYTYSSSSTSSNWGTLNDGGNSFPGASEK